MSELLNCPFCGSPAQTRRFGAHDDLFMIECGNQFGACCSMQTVPTPDAVTLLKKKWNTRYPYVKCVGEIVNSSDYAKVCQEIEECEEIWQ